MPIICHYRDCKALLSIVFVVEQRYIKYLTFTFYLYLYKRLLIIVNVKCVHALPIKFLILAVFNL